MSEEEEEGLQSGRSGENEERLQKVCCEGSWVSRRLTFIL